MFIRSLLDHLTNPRRSSRACRRSTTGNCTSLAPSSPSYLGNGNCHLRRFPFPVHDVVEEGSEEKKKKEEEKEEKEEEKEEKEEEEEEK